jgi:hypothetical protein
VNMDDFLSRLDSSLDKDQDQGFVHQDLWGEETFIRSKWGESYYSNATINTEVLGLYILTYDVADMHGNEATQISRFVVVQDDSEIYQNSIQQVYDGTAGSFTGGVLPHETGGSIRVASSRFAGLAELSRNRPTAASSLWGVHTPASAAVDGLYTNSYVEPVTSMDEYGRTMALDHIPNIFMSGPSVWLLSTPPTDTQWWRVHLASFTDNPTVVVHMRDCCTEQFYGAYIIC